MTEDVDPRVTALADMMTRLFDDSTELPKEETFQRLAVLALREVPQLLVDPQPSEGMMITTLYSRRAHQPVVQVEFAEPLRLLQLLADDVKKFSLDLVEAANAAITDAFVLEFFRDTMGMEEGHQWSLLRQFRQWREARIGGREDTPGPSGIVQP